MEQIIGRTIRKNYVEKAAGDARHTSADITKAKQILGYSPQVSLVEGLTKEWEWIQSISI